MATPIYDRIRKSNKKNKTMAYFADGQPKVWKKGDKPIVETNIAGAPAPGIGPIKFTAVTGKPSAAYGEETRANIVEATESTEDDANKPDLGVCDPETKTNTVTGKECELPSEIIEDRKSDRAARKKERLAKNNGGTDVGNFLRGIFGGGGKSTVAKLTEDPSGATIVEDQGTPIEDHEPGKPGPHLTGDAALNQAVLGAGGEQGLGEGELITIGGDVYDSTYDADKKLGEDKVIKGDEVEKLLLPEDFPLGEKDPEYIKRLAALNEAIAAGADERYKDKIIKGDPKVVERSDLRKKKLIEKDPGKDAEYAYNMGWADTMMQNWQQGSERRGNERNENKNMNKIWKEMTKNERDEMKDVIKEMKEAGDGKRGVKNQRLAAIQLMQQRANDPDYKWENPQQKKNYSAWAGDFNWGSGSQEANRNIFDTTTKSYKDKVINANRNNKGADISVGGSGGGFIKTSDKIDASSSERDMKFEDLTPEEQEKLAGQYDNPEEWLNKKRLESGLDKDGKIITDESDSGDNASEEDNNPFADLPDMKDFAKTLKTRTLSEFMEENPLGPQPNAERPVDENEVDPNELEIKDEEEIVEDDITAEDDLKLNYKPPTKFKLKSKSNIVKKWGRPGY